MAPMMAGTLHERSTGGGTQSMIEAFWKCDDLKTECEMKGKEKYCRIREFEWGVQSPRDEHSGLPTGKRMHEPLVIVKELDKSTPLIIQALVQNTTLKKCELILCQPYGKEAKRADTFQVVLENCYVIKEHTTAGEHEHLVLEEVALVYEKITWTHIPGSTGTSDTWKEV